MRWRATRWYAQVSGFLNVSELHYCTWLKLQQQNNPMLFYETHEFQLHVWTLLSLWSPSHLPRCVHKIMAADGPAVPMWGGISPEWSKLMTHASSRSSSIHGMSPTAFLGQLPIHFVISEEPGSRTPICWQCVHLMYKTCLNLSTYVSLTICGIPVYTLPSGMKNSF